MAEPVPVPGLPPGIGTAISAWAKGFFGQSGGTYGPAVNARIDELPPDLQREVRGTVRDISRSDSTGLQKSRDIERIVRDAETEAGRLESESEDDPFQYDPPDGELSPVFGGAAVGLGIGMSDAMRAALEKQIGKLERRLKITTPTTTRKVVVNKFGKTATAKIPKTLEARVANIAIKAAQRAVGPASQVAKKIPKVGGPAGTVGVIGAQFGIEKIAQVVSDRQFREMERILKTQQAETNKAVRKIRLAQQKSGISPPPGKPPAGATTSSRSAATPARARAPAGAPGLEPIRPKLPAKKPEILGPGTPLPTAGIGGPGPVAKLLQFAKTALPLAALTNIGSSNKQTFAPAVPSPARQSQSSLSSYFGTTRSSSSAGLCECKPKTTRAKSSRKRKAPRVCVSKSVAARAGIAA